MLTMYQLQASIIRIDQSEDSVIRIDQSEAPNLTIDHSQVTWTARTAVTRPEPGVRADSAGVMSSGQMRRENKTKYLRLRLFNISLS